jgi:glycosyltransferase involved in cell wall biosynthesis
MGQTRLSEPRIPGPKVSILIPTYNQAAFIREAVESALAQSYSPLEVIVGDDCSSDETTGIVGAFSDSRLHYVRNTTNRGRCGNYRSLLARATGDFIVNLDGDDYFTDPDFISEAVRRITDRDDVMMVVARVTTRSPRGEAVSSIPAVARIAGLDLLKKLPQEEFLPMHMGVLYVRNTALENDFYRSDTTSSDWESLFRLSLHGYVEYLDRNIGVWRIHGKNETERVDVSKLVNDLSIWEPIFSEAVLFGMNPAWARLKTAQCVAFFSQMHVGRVSTFGNSELVSFLRSIFRQHTLAFLLMLSHPLYLARLGRAFAGVYRRKWNKT